MTNQEAKALIEKLLGYIRDEAYACIDSKEPASPIQILIGAQLRLSNSAEKDSDMASIEHFRSWKEEIQELSAVLNS